jgi:hypothetical protein
MEGSMTHVRNLILFIVFGTALAAVGFAATKPRALVVASKPPDPGAEVARLQAELARLEALVPNQPTVMTQLAYHFANLWFAAAHQNWPLADYYLGEMRSNLKWAVRIKPTRSSPAGEVNLAGIAGSVDNTEFSKLQEAIHEHRSAAFDRAYDETAVACYACHKAIGKPYLRPQRPPAAAEHVINPDPAAKWPP